MDYKKDLLLRSAARLYSLGIEVEAASSSASWYNRAFPTIPPKCEKLWRNSRSWISSGKRWSEST